MKKIGINLNIPVSILREGNRFVAYTPALDVSTSGKTYKEVQNRFEELVALFIEEIIKNDSIDEVLSELGWEKKKKKDEKINWIPPVIVSQDTRLITL